MEYVSLAKSRAGWQPDAPKKRAKKPTPETSTDPVASNTNPDDGLSVSKHEED